MSPMSMWIIIAIAGIGIIFGIIRQIDWYQIFSKKWGNSPLRAKIYIHFGRDVVFEDGEYVYVDEKYIFYTYDYHKEKYAVAVKQDQFDEFSNIRGRVMIHVKFGEGVTALKTDLTNKAGKEIIASVGSPELPARQPGVATIGAVELNSSVKSKVTSELVNSIGNRGGIKFMAIVMIIAVVAGAIIFYKVYQNNQAEKQQQNLPPVTTTTTPDPNDPLHDLIIEDGGK